MRRVRSGLSIGAVSVLCIGALWGVWHLTRSGDGSSADSVNASAGHAVVLVDGWSWETISQEPAWGTQNTARESAAWRVATKSQLRDVLQTDPDAIARLMARMVVAVPRPTCSADGCASGDKSLSLDLLTNPGSIETYGKMYKALGVGPVRIAQLSFPETTTQLTLRSGEGAPVNLALRVSTRTDTSLSGEAKTAYDQELAASQSGQRTSANVLTLAGAFGALFPLDPAWTPAAGPSRESAYTHQGVLGNFNEANVSQFTSGDSPFSRGLSEAVSGAADMSSSALTAFSSPTTGCLGLAACVPGRADVTVTASPVSYVSVCDTQTTPGVNAAPVGDAPRTRVGIVVRDEIWEMRLSHPIAQGGAWGGKTPDAPVAGIWGDGPMPLFGGGNRLRIATAWVYSGEGQLYGIGGRVVEIGADPDSDVTASWGTAQALRALGEGRYVDCATVAHVGANPSGVGPVIVLPGGGVVAPKGQPPVSQRQDLPLDQANNSTR